MHIMSFGGNHCKFNLSHNVGHDITIWLGFHRQQTSYCQFNTDGDYVLTPPLTMSPTLDPTVFPTEIPTENPTTPTECTYFYRGPIDIYAGNRVDNITLNEYLDISFQLKTVPNWECPEGFCNILRIGVKDDTVPKLPNLSVKANLEGEQVFRLVMHENNGTRGKWSITNGFDGVYNDGLYHNYSMLIT